MPRRALGAESATGKFAEDAAYAGAARGSRARGLASLAKFAMALRALSAALGAPAGLGRARLEDPRSWPPSGALLTRGRPRRST